MTAIVDVNSFYVFRADISYDYTIRLEDISKDTKEYYDDHTYSYLMKNARLAKYKFEPQLSTANDSESFDDYLEAKEMFDARDNFVEGLHVQKNYTILPQHHIL